MAAMFRRQPHVSPRNVADLILIAEANRRAIRVARWGIAFLVVALPLVAWVAVTIGERGREQNCRVVRHFANDLTRELAIAFRTDPDGPEARAFRSKLAEDLAACA